MMTSRNFLWFALMVVVRADETSLSRIELPCDQYVNSSNYRSVLGSWRVSVSLPVDGKYTMGRDYPVTISELTNDDLSKYGVSSESQLSTNPKLLFAIEDKIQTNDTEHVVMEVADKFIVVPGSYKKAIIKAGINVVRFGDIFAMLKSCNSDSRDCVKKSDVQLFKTLKDPSQEFLKAVGRCFRG